MNFEKIYEMYTTCNERIYDYLSNENFDEIYKEASKNLKYYEFTCWLDSIYEYYH